MPKKQKRAATLAEMVAALPPPAAEGPCNSYVDPPVAARGFTDTDGIYWRLARGPLDPRRAERLATDADVMSLGIHYDDEVGRWLPSFLAQAERPVAWLEARVTLGAAYPPAHEAYEFTADDGRILLFIETYC
ncbi:hypothetical protein ACFQ9J_16455 [Streptomyces sp. NPDC056529]|uniref:hypothetical protein n=1 Tax=Streptomyces sp. NPDC056529 TaxID=3345855 RepID=UPI0036A85BE9